MKKTKTNTFSKVRVAKRKKTILNEITDITISFDSGKCFTFYKDGLYQYKIAETKVPKRYWNINLRITDTKKLFVMNLDLFKPDNFKKSKYET